MPLQSDALIEQLVAYSVAIVKLDSSGVDCRVYIAMESLGKVPSPVGRSGACLLRKLSVFTTST